MDWRPKFPRKVLNLTSRFLKPLSVPQTSDQSSWKRISETLEYKNLGGINGQMTSISWSANTGQVDCEIWISDNKELVAFRQTFTNKTGKSIKLNALYPLFIDGNGSFKFGEIPDWRILEQFRHKNDLPKSEAAAASKIRFM